MVRDSCVKKRFSLGSIYPDNDLVACTWRGTPYNPASDKRTFNRRIKAADVPKIFEEHSCIFIIIQGNKRQDYIGMIRAQ